ncbi:histone-lysine N-methyltransferase SETD7, partial [Eurytemora carolleeae]|uniref:histone-lysine N-methyltransferase SETD7 n=1 Tax=Eurytemora carolleeae TaxID=1294199 RepID=UPI000C7601DB
SMKNYCASLAHKTNHSFLPNCEFSEIFHPRWGFTPCLVTRQDVARDEELLVMYGYDLDYCPEWYKDAWENSCSGFETDKLKSG